MEHDKSDSNRWNTIFEKLAKTLHFSDEQLPSLDDILKVTRSENSRYIGCRPIKVANIIGSEGRYGDFEKNFMLKNKALQNRYNTICKLHQQGHIFPPICVYKIDDYYFVQDGNHRVAVAKEMGQEFIDADITEIVTDVPITDNLTQKNLLLIEEHSNFLKLTGIGRHGRMSNIHLTEVHLYKDLLEIIYEYNRLLSKKNERSYSLEEAAELWYRKVFLPFAEDAYQNDLLSMFPGRTTGDLYVWVQLHWNEIKNAGEESYKYIDDVSNDIQAASNEHFSKSELSLLRNVFSRKRPAAPNFMLENVIGIAVCCVLFHIDKNYNVHAIIVKRKYHPSERQWSLPIAMMRKDETVQDAAQRCQHNVLGLKSPCPVKQFSIHDDPKRHPFCRSLSINIMGFLFNRSGSFKFQPGGVASELLLCKPDELPELVFDHNEILVESFPFIAGLIYDFDEVVKLFPPEIETRGVSLIMKTFERLAQKCKAKE